MSRCLGYFLKNETRKVTVFVATSGDTGGAVANGFMMWKEIEVVIFISKKWCKSSSGKAIDGSWKKYSCFGSKWKF